LEINDRLIADRSDIWGSGQFRGPFRFGAAELFCAIGALPVQPSRGLLKAGSTG
jgi:hypothetical protein